MKIVCKYRDYQFEHCNSCIYHNNREIKQLHIYICYQSNIVSILLRNMSLGCDRHAHCEIVL